MSRTPMVVAADIVKDGDLVPECRGVELRHSVLPFDPAVRQCIDLMCHSELHRRWYVNDIPRLVYPPIRNRNLFFYRTERGYVGYVSFAFLSQEAEQAFENGERPIQPEDWMSGDRIWLIDLIALDAFGSVIARNLRQSVLPRSGYPSARSLRRTSEGEIRKFNLWTAPSHRKTSEERS